MVREHFEEVSAFGSAIASGDPIDRLAYMVGIERKPGESDDELRRRTELAKESL
jgi:hypothetical protein